MLERKVVTVSAGTATTKTTTTGTVAQSGCAGERRNTSGKMCQKDSRTKVVGSNKSGVVSSFSCVHKMSLKENGSFRRRTQGTARGKRLSKPKSLLCTLALILISSSLGESHVRINENGGYEDVVVSISKEIPPIACQQLIQNIQGVISSASEYLRRATDGRVYFHRVTIVIPPNWDSVACRGALPSSSYTSRGAVNEATIRIGTEHPIFGQFPWTQQSRGCGLPGDFISVGYHYILQFNETENGIVGSSASSPSSSLGSTKVSSYGGSHNSGNSFNEPENDFDNHYDGSAGSRGYGSSYDTNNGMAHGGIKSGSVPAADRAFVKEWAKFRYGVFEEIGFPNDPIYPTYYKEGGERKPTSCTNLPLRGNWSSGCDESYWSNYYDLNGTCVFTPTTSGSTFENDRITSSIMSFPQLKNVRLFCDQTNHNSKAPTKQNFLCDGKSTSEVIYAHPDFRNLGFREPNVPVPTPEFVVKQITTPRFVLLVEETGNMNLRDVWKFLKLAVRKFIKYDLPSGTQIGLISVSTADVRILSNMTSLQTLTLRRALADKLPNYPNVDSGGNISLRRGIFQAVELLKRNKERASGSVIILVSQGTVSSTDLEASLELLRAEEVTLAAIEYPSLGDGKISLLSEGTNGPHFAIRETGVGPTTHMSTFVQLINALMTIQKYFTEDVSPTWPIMIHQAEYKGDSRSYVEANFSFESATTQSPAEFFIYTSNPNDPKINSVELTSPNGVKYTTQLSDLHDINVIKIDALINEPGVWRYRIERLADSHQSHFVQVVTKTSTEDLNARLYTNLGIHDKPANLSATPLVLYCEVKQKRNSPVIEADVEATIVTGNKKWTVRLLDNGNGDPDVTRGDGVYSRYFIVPPGETATSAQLEISARVVVNPYRARYVVVSQPMPGSPLSSSSSQFSSSTLSTSSLGGVVGGSSSISNIRYSNSLQQSQSQNLVSHQQCCGSFVAPADPKTQYKIMPFAERSSNSLIVRVSDIPPVGFYTPGRIGDLRIAQIDGAKRNVTLTWTAPGEDLDQGVPASYQVFFSTNTVNENWSMLTEIKADLEAGVEDNVTITLPKYGQYLVAIRAVDYYAKWGKMSNIVKVNMVPPPREPEHGYHSGSSVAGGGGSTLSIKNTTPPPNDELSRLDLLLIVVCGLAFVFLLGGLIVILLYCRRIGSSQRKSNKKNPGDTKIAAITDPKSPIHWSASELLGEHEKRHSLYGGSVSPNNSDKSMKQGQNQHHQQQQHEMQQSFHSQNQINQNSHHNGLPNGHPHNMNHPHPMHLNIIPGDYVVGTSTSTRSRSSPDSYDDPDSPTPIPVSVRHMGRPAAGPDYSICVDSSSNLSSSRVNHNQPPPPHHHLQLQETGTNTPSTSMAYGHPHLPPSYHQQQYHYQIPQNGGLVVAATAMGTSYAVSNPTVNRYSTANNPSPLPQLPPQVVSQIPGYPAPPSHQMHYDPEIQGSMSSVNSKKRNITMV